MTLNVTPVVVPSLLVIAGATASGKSALAMELAQALGGELVALDSVQVYRSFDIGSAKPSRRDRSLVPHHLIDVLEPAVSVDAQWYVRFAEDAIRDIHARTAVPIVVGGTTMYLTALLHGLIPQPDVSDSLRAELRKRSATDLFQELSEKDPETATTLAPTDKIRIVRALEILQATGTTASAARRAHGFNEMRYQALIVVPMWPRDQLYERIDHRVGEMLDRGLLDEVRGLMSTYGATLHPLRSLGYAQCVAVLQGELPERDLAAAISTATRRYAKRQLTYLRNEPRKRGWRVLPTEEPHLVHKPLASGGTRRRSEYADPALRLSKTELIAQIQRVLASGLSGTEVWFVDAGALEMA